MLQLPVSVIGGATRSGGEAASALHSSVRRDQIPHAFRRVQNVSIGQEAGPEAGLTASIECAPWPPLSRWPV